MKRIICICLCVCFLICLSGAFALDASEARAVIGADLTAEQTEVVYESFGIKRGDVTELNVTNEEERKYLDGLVEDSVIGSRSISCVYIEMLSEGSGLEVRTNNISWCSKEMYINALVTAGIDDAKVIVSAPWAVSGTAALTGIFKAYEDISGEALDETAKHAGTRELIITAGLADEIGSYDAVTIVNELKLLLNETKEMSDKALHAEIKRIASEYSIKLTDGQVEQLASLCRTLEKMGVHELKEKVESVQQTFKKFTETKEKAETVVQRIKNMVASVTAFFSNLLERFL